MSRLRSQNPDFRTVQANAVYFYLDATIPADRLTLLHSLTSAAISQIITSLK